MGACQLILLDAEEMGARVACRPITDSIRLLTNHSTTIALCGAPGPRAIGKGDHVPHLDDISAGSFLPSYVSLYYLESVAIRRLTHLHTRAALHSHTHTASQSTATTTSGRIGTCSIDIGSIGEHTKKQKKRTSDPAGVHIFLWCKASVVHSNG